jgi:hypothetical protein
VKERKTQIIIEDGREVVKVPLGRTDKVCYVYKDDRDFLRRLGLSMNWNISPQGYVTAPAKASNGYVMVARIIMNVGPGQQVRYRDGDGLNLRTGNLHIVHRNGAIRRDRDLVRPGHHLQKHQPVNEEMMTDA